MRPVVVGARTVTTVLLCALVGVLAWARGALSAEQLAARGGETLFVVGCFGVVVGTLMFRFWRLGEASRHAFRSGAESPSWGRTDAHFLGAGRVRITIGEARGEAF